MRKAALALTLSLAIVVVFQAHSAAWRLAEAGDTRHQDLDHAEIRIDLSSSADTESVSNAVFDGGGFGVAALGQDAELVTRPMPVPLADPKPFLAVTGLWSVQPISSLDISLRSSIDGNAWTGWTALEADADSSSGDEVGGHLVFLPAETRVVQFRLTLSGQLPSSTRVLSFRAAFISPGESDPALELPAESLSIAALTKPAVVSRTAWGSPDGASSPGWTPQYTTVTHLIVHHTVDSNGNTDWAAVVRAIWSYHTYTKGWGDIGYNYLVDPNGVVYEGRAGGDNVIGAHFSCANSNTMGVAFLGTFSTVQPTQAAWNKVVQLLGWKANQRAISPLGVSYHPSTQLQLPNIAGHRDANGTVAPGTCDKGTECPGNALYPMLPVLRSDVAALISGGSDSTAPTISSFTASPNSVVLGGTFTVQATMSDAGTGLSRIGWWRAPDAGGSPGTWTEIGSSNLSGTGPVTNTFFDTPGSTGTYWYGIHVTDVSGNVAYEPNGPLSRTVTAASTRIIGVSGNLAFGNVQVGTTVQRTLTITNSGTSTLTISGYTMPNGFTAPLPAAIAAGTSQTVMVTFAPTVATTYGGTIAVQGNQTGGTNAINASGTGTSATTRIISVSGNLAFGAVQIGTSAQRMITISNSGNSSLTISGFTMPNGFSAVVPATIPAGSSQTVAVTFTPSAAIGYGGTIVVVGNQTSGANTIGASGTGLPAGTYFADDMEAGGSNWVGGPWALTTEAAHSGTHAWSDSPGGFYGPNGNVSLFSPVIDLGTAVRPQLRFWHRYDIVVDGNDLANVYITTDNGASYQRLGSYWGAQPGWIESVIDLTAFAGQGAVKLVFQVYSNGSLSGDGWYVDDVVVKELAKPSVTTDPATNIGQFSATLNGTVNPNGAPTQTFFEYGPTLSYGAGITGPTLTNATTQNLQGAASLTCGLQYHFRLRAMNAAGETTGPDLTFNSLPCPITRSILLNGALAFGPVPALSSAMSTLRISNFGNATLTVSGITYPSGYSGTWSGTIPPNGAFHDVTVTFSPTTATAYNGTITVNSNKTDGTETIAVSGTGTSASSTTPFDFTGDLKSDVLWRHNTRGEVWLWPMNGAAKLSENFVRTVSDTNWEIRGQGDQNGDLKADILWRNRVTGGVIYWPMNGSIPLTETFVATVDPYFDIVGTGDYNGDGKSDILWRNGTNGQVWIWLMNGATALSMVLVDTVDPIYAVVGSGDLNADNKADIVWRNTVNGDVWVWLMNGTTRTSSAMVGTVPDLNYQIAGVADYTGDHKADILWRHAAQGHVWIWPMNGASVTTQSFVSTVDPIYTIVGTGDYNGDGKTDILWHHGTVGDVWVWLMNGAAISSQTLVGRVPDVGYQIVKWR